MNKLDFVLNSSKHYRAQKKCVAKKNLKLILKVGVLPKFITGNRLTGYRGKGSFRFLNLVGNIVFSILWFPLLNYRFFDLFCGSKIFPKSLLNQLDNEILEIDDYGDLTLLYAAQKNNLKIESISVDYLARSYGTSNMLRWTTAQKFLSITLKVYAKKLSQKNTN